MIQHSLEDNATVSKPKWNSTPLVLVVACDKGCDWSVLLFDGNVMESGAYIQCCEEASVSHSVSNVQDSWHGKGLRYGDQVDSAKIYAQTVKLHCTIL